jgi:hypothetical protein
MCLLRLQGGPKLRNGKKERNNEQLQGHISDIEVLGSGT